MTDPERNAFEAGWNAALRYYFGRLPVPMPSRGAAELASARAWEDFRTGHSKERPSSRKALARWRKVNG